MNKTEKEALLRYLKNSIEVQSQNAILLDAEGKIDKQEYNSEDLLNSLQIFMHILGNISISYGIRKGYNKKMMEMLATEMGKSLKQTVNLHTGIDVPSLVKRLYDK